MINLADLESYLKFLNPNPDYNFTCAFLDSYGRETLSGLGVFHGTRAEVVEKTLSVHEELGGTLHVTLNETDGCGRRTKNVLRARVLCVDRDVCDVGFLERLRDAGAGLMPMLVVESSPGKFHLYWKVDAATVPLGVWKVMQTAFAYKFGGERPDYGMTQVTRTIRAPGVGRVCKDGEMWIPRIVYAWPTPVTLTYEALKSRFPWIDACYEEALLAQQRAFAARRRALGEVRRGDWGKVSASAEVGGRNNFVYSLLQRELGVFKPELGAGFMWDTVSGLELARQINGKLTEGLDEAELEKIVKSALVGGREMWERRRLRYLGIKSALGGSMESGSSVAPAQENMRIAQNSLPNLSIAEVGMETTEAEGTGEVLVNGHAAVEAPKPVLSGFQYDFTDPVLGRNPYTDEALTVRIFQKYGHLIRKNGKDMYCFHMEEEIWEEQTQSRNAPAIGAFVGEVVQDILEEPGAIAQFCMTPEGDISEKKRRKMEVQFQSERLRSSIIRMVLSWHKVRKVEPGEFDARPGALFCCNGLVDMGTGEIRCCRAEDMMLCRTDVRYRYLRGEVEGCSGWLEFLKQVFPKNTLEMIRFIQEIFGYSISGLMGEQVVFVHHGDGANGKSKLLSALAAIAGEYATTIAASELSTKRGMFVGSLERFGAKIEGKRIAIVDDLDVVTVWNEGFLKTATATSVRAEDKWIKSHKLVNRCKVHLGANVIPTQEAENEGLIRRLCIINYNVHFESDMEASDRIDAMIQAEKSAILGWAMEGYRRVVVQKKIKYPEQITEAGNEYRRSNFTLEEALKSLYEKGGETEFEWASDVLTEVNKYLAQEGESERITPEKLSRGIGRCFEVVGVKRRHPEKGNSFKSYRLRPLFKRSSTTDLL